jgi:serine/threonine-protein phosphatase 2A regulatory subunit B
LLTGVMALLKPFAQSTVEFSHNGDYLATGDKGGRVVLFERSGSSKKGCEYKFYTEFQSHEPEFDYLKSLEIEEKINRIRWCKRANAAHFLLSTNGAFPFPQASVSS